MHPFIAAAQADIDRSIPDLIAICQDLHRHPERSMHEMRTAKIAADAVAAHGFEVTSGVGGTDAQAYAQAKAAEQLNTLPSNHSHKYAPVPDPVLKAGLQAMLAAAAAWLYGSESAA